MNKRDFSFKHSLTTLSVCSLLAFSSTAALAQTGDAPVWRTDLTGGETTTYALSDLAPGMAGKPVKLTGSNNSGYFDFTVKPDEVVTSGELTLNFTVSPSMLANVTQLNIFLNGELQQTAALSAKQIGKPQSLVFNLDSKSFRTGQNQVRVEFVGHYQTVCENASNPSLWMDIAPESELALNKAFVRLPNDLSQFPAPFISEGNSGQNTTLPIVFAQLMVASIAAYGFTRWRGKVRDSLFFFYVILMLMPYQVTLVPNYLVSDWLHLLNTRWAIFLPGAFAPFSVFLLTKFMRRIPMAVIESAKIDGANEWHIFWNICLPQCRSALYSIAILVFIDNWNMVEQPLILLNDVEKQPLSMFLSSINAGEIGIAFAAAVIYMIPGLLLFLHGEAYLVEGIAHSGSVKG